MISSHGMVPVKKKSNTLPVDSLRIPPGPDTSIQLMKPKIEHADRAADDEPVMNLELAEIQQNLREYERRPVSSDDSTVVPRSSGYGVHRRVQRGGLTLPADEAN